MKRFSTAAHDPAHDVFLVVWGVSQPRTGTYLVTYQGPADDTWAVEVDGAGIVSTPFAVIETPGRLNTQPRVVADALRARWLVTTNVDYTTVAGRFVEALPR